MSKLVFPRKPVIAVDWDGTCVEHVYPKQGDWLEGAPEALRVLTRKFKVYIWTSRIAPVTFENWDVQLSEDVIKKEYDYIRKMLDDANLKSVGIWDNPFKLPAMAYVDDRAIRYSGNWAETLLAIVDGTGVSLGKGSRNVDSLVPKASTDTTQTKELKQRRLSPIH